MPGPNITRYLRPCTHSSFYWLAQQVFYHLIVLQTKAASEVQIAARVMDLSELGQFFPQPQDAKALQAQIRAVLDAGTAMVNETRQFSYRCKDGQHLYPYDDGVWDLLFSEVAVSTFTATQNIRRLMAEVQIPEQLSVPETTELNLHRLEVLQNLKATVEKRLVEIENFLDHEAVDAWVGQWER